VQWLLTSDFPESSAATASGCGSDTVSGSSLAYRSKPQSLAAAISNATACPEIFTDGTAIRSRSVKSAMARTSGSRVVTTKGWDCTALKPRTSCGVPAVLSHKVASDGTAATPNCSWPLRMPSITALGPPSVTHATSSAARPWRAACFSTSFSCSITISGR
jgi:hypothetical protein